MYPTGASPFAKNMTSLLEAMMLQYGPLYSGVTQSLYTISTINGRSRWQSSSPGIVPQLGR